VSGQHPKSLRADEVYAPMPEICGISALIRDQVIMPPKDRTN
jgi:hypothetical protein